VQTFDDPNLQAALKRTLGRETAPPGLRERVLYALDESESSSRRAWFTFRGQQKFGAIAAAAAVILLVVGYAVYQGMHPGGGGKQIVMKLPKPFAEAMVAGHDSAVASADFPAPNTDPNALAQQLQTQVGVKPMVSLPADSGWTLKGAKVATLNNVATAQAVFSKGNAKISVYSVPARAVYSPVDGATYDQVTDRHPIAGFVRKTTMYCIVGDAGASIDELKQLTTRLEQETKG
jgi:hypothetical protein